VPSEPSSPEEAKKVSCFARPRWKVWSNLANCPAAEAPPKASSLVPNDIENTVPAGYFATAQSMAFIMFGMPCTPWVSATGVPMRTMCALGAIAYAHWTSRFASPAQPSADVGPAWPLPLPVAWV
jgi:hypothetical protein